MCIRILISLRLVKGFKRYSIFAILLPGIWNPGTTRAKKGVNKEEKKREKTNKKKLFLKENRKSGNVMH